MGLVATKPIIGVSDKVKFKPVFSAAETSEKIEISPVSSLDMILSNKRITKALTSLRACASWSVPLLFANPEDRFSCVEAHIKAASDFISYQFSDSPGALRSFCTIGQAGIIVACEKHA